MIDYAKEIKEVDSKPKIKNKELIYIREKAKIHNLDTVAISLAENLVIIGLKGIDALSIVTKYRMVIKTNFKYSYLSIANDPNNWNKKKENIIGLFEHLHLQLLEEDCVEELIENKKIINEKENSIDISNIDYDKMLSDIKKTNEELCGISPMDKAFIDMQLEMKNINRDEYSLSEFFIREGYNVKEAIDLIIEYRDVIKEEFELSHFFACCNMSRNMKERKAILRGLLNHLRVNERGI